MDVELQVTEIETTPLELTTPNVEVCTGDEDIELVVTRKEFNVVGDSIYIGNRIDDTPQWLMDYIDTLNALSLDAKISGINGLSESLEDLIDAMNVAKNAYTSAIITYEELELMVNAKVETLNSTLSGADATIINLLITKVTPTEAQAIAITALQASIHDGDISALIGDVRDAIVYESGARAIDVLKLTAQLDGFEDTYSTALTGLETTVSNQGGTLAAHAEEFTNLTTGVNTGDWAGTGVNNSLSLAVHEANVDAQSKFAYNSTLVIGSQAYNSGFGLTSTGSTGTNVTVDGTSYPLWNSEFWIKADNFKMVAASQSAAAQSPFSVNATTGQITFNGVVSFSNITNVPQLGSTPQQVVDAVNAGITTTIDGGKITTGTVTASQIAASTITASQIATSSISADRLSSTNGNSTVWNGGGLVSSNFNGNVVGSIGAPTQGFRLSSNATGTSADPNIYGAYIKGATLEGTTMSTGDIRVSADGYPNNYGPIMLLEAYSGTTNISSLFRGRGYSSGYDSKRMCSTAQTFILQASTAGTWGGIYGSIITTAVTIYVSVNGGAWTTLASNSSVLGQIFCSTVYVADSSSSVQFMSTHSSGTVNGAVFSIQSINGPSA